MSLPETLMGPMPHDRCMRDGCPGTVRFAYHGFDRYNACVNAVSACDVCGDEEWEFIACAAPECTECELKHDGAGLRQIGRTDDEAIALWVAGAFGAWADEELPR